MLARFAWHLLIPMAIFPGAILCSAQVDLAGLSGTVTDRAGKLNPGLLTPAGLGARDEQTSWFQRLSSMRQAYLSRRGRRRVSPETDLCEPA